MKNKIYYHRNEQKFYFKGKVFTDEDKFWEASRKWPFEKTDQQTFSEEWEHLGKEIWLNIEMLEIEMSNGALTEILGGNLIYLLDKVFRNEADKKERGKCLE